MGLPHWSQTLLKKLKSQALRQLTFQIIGKLQILIISLQLFAEHNVDIVDAIVHATAKQQDYDIFVSIRTWKNLPNFIITTQSEYALEQALVAQLKGMEYPFVRIDNESDMRSSLKRQFTLVPKLQLGNAVQEALASRVTWS